MFVIGDPSVPNHNKVPSQYSDEIAVMDFLIGFADFSQMSSKLVDYEL